MSYLLRKLLSQYPCEEANGGDGGGSAGGSGGSDPTPNDGSTPADKGGEDPAGKGGDDPNKSSKKPSDEEARLLKEVMQKKDALNKANQELNSIRDQLKRFDGIDPDAVRKVLAEQKAAEEKQLEAKGEWDRLKGRMAEEHQKEVGSLNTRIQELEAELNKTRGTVNELSIGTLFGQSRFISDDLTLTPSKARMIYGDYFDLENGQVVGYDKPRGANGRTAMVDQYGNAVGFDDALRKIIEADPEKDHLLKSKFKPGAGSDSKPVSGAKSNANANGDQLRGMGKIAAGLGSLKIKVNNM